MVDVGLGKEASDAKMREYLRLYAANAQCGLIVRSSPTHMSAPTDAHLPLRSPQLLGASHDNGYAPILSSLATEGRLGNVLLLKGYNSVAFELQQYKHLTVEIPGLFRAEKVVIIPGSYENKPFINNTPKKVAPIAIAKSKIKAKTVVLEDLAKKGSGAVSASDDSDNVTTDGEDSETAGDAYASKKLIVEDEDDSDDLTTSIRKLAVSAKKAASQDASTATPKSGSKTTGSGFTQTSRHGAKDFTFSMKLTEDNGWVGVKTPKAAAGTPAGKVFAPIIGGPNDVEGTPTRKIKGGKQPKTIKVDGNEHVVRTLYPRPCHK